METTENNAPKATRRVIVSATFTATPIEEYLRFWTTTLRIPCDIGFAPYQQLFQTLIDPESIFASNQAGANVALFRLEDLAPNSDPNLIESHLRDLVEALKSAATRLRAPVIFCLCPPSSSFEETLQSQHRSTRLKTEICRQVRAVPNLYFLDTDALIARYHITVVEDALADRVGHVPYHAEFFAALGTQIFRTMLAHDRKPVKAVALDCDNTLWSGVAGEDGPEGVEIDSGRKALQNFLLRKRAAGMLLAIASKNNESDVRETFAIHPEMVLKWEHIVAHRINWEPKSQNLLELASELNLGLDSFVFLDDDAKECGEVCADLPEIVTLRIPHTTADISDFLEHAWIFDRGGAVTVEDRERSRMYAAEIERNRFEKQAKDFREFLAGLRLEVVFAPVTAETLPRAAQLTQRTNQMNAALTRYKEQELRSALDSGKVEAFGTSVSDRFGSYGLVGLVIFHVDGDAICIDDFLLSCRALGRGVEQRMLAHVADVAIQQGKPAVTIAVTRGPRNQPAVQLIRSVFGGLPDGQVAVTLSRPASDLLKLEMRLPASPVAETAAQAISVSDRKTSASQAIDYQHIAESFRTARSILAAVQNKKRESARPRQPSGAAPESPLQQRLAAIWRDLLGLESVGIDEDFFDLGGHSLLAVQLLSRVHDEIGVDLPDSVIYGDKLRIDNLARTIELQQLGVSDQAAYDAMLAEIESLSDEEVAALLAEEEDRK